MRTFQRCATVLALIALSACSMGGGSGGSANPSPTAMSDAQILTIGKRVAQCIRDNGVPNFPDPTVEDGHLILPEEVEARLEREYSKPVLDRAEKACQPILDELPESALRSESESEKDEDRPGAEDVDALRKFAQCMRENGMPQWPDPKADGSFPVEGTGVETEGKSPRFINATRKCQRHWDGNLWFSKDK